MSALRNSLDTVIDKLGLYDIVLPFLLVFTITFAILEKTKVFGVEKIDNQVYTRKNLNAMAAFVVAFFVVMSNKLVQAITRTTSNFVLLLLSSILFLMLIGSFAKESDEGVELSGAWKVLFEVIMFIGLAIIFLTSITTSDGRTLLEVIWDFVSGGIASISSEVWSGLLLLIILGGAIFYITGGKVSTPKKKKEEE